MPINFTHLAAFHAVAEEGHFTRGADRLSVSQPAVSKQIAELERAMGVELFARGGRRVVLTDAGRTLHAYARRIFALADEAHAALADLSRLRRGRLRIGATPTIGTYFLPQLLVYFRRQFPEIALTVDVHHASELEAKTLDGRLDCLLTTAEPNEPALRATCFMQQKRVVVSAGPAAAKKPVSLREAASWAWVVREAGAIDRTAVERSFAFAGCPITPALTLATTEAVKQAVLAGLGVAALPEMAVRSEIRDGSLRVVPVKGMDLDQQIFWVERAELQRSKAAQAFWCIVEHAAAGKLPQPRPVKRG